MKKSIIIIISTGVFLIFNYFLPILKITYPFSFNVTFLLGSSTSFYYWDGSLSNGANLLPSFANLPFYYSIVITLFTILTTLDYILIPIASFLLILDPIAELLNNPKRLYIQLKMTDKPYLLYQILFITLLLASIAQFILYFLILFVILPDQQLLTYSVNISYFNLFLFVIGYASCYLGFEFYYSHLDKPRTKTTTNMFDKLDALEKDSSRGQF